jgi:hypothetical protein
MGNAKNSWISKLVTITLMIVAITHFSNLEAKAQYPGTNLRGRVLASGAYGQPFLNARVDLYAFNTITSSWVLVTTSYTDYQGFYYFRFVPPGNHYAIQINGKLTYQVQVSMIDYRYYTFQDLPALNL